MTDDAESAVTERTGDEAESETADQASESAQPGAVAVLETEAETEPAESAAETTGGDGDSAPPPDAPSAEDDDGAAAAPARTRRVNQLLGTLLIAAGLPDDRPDCWHYRLAPAPAGCRDAGIPLSRLDPDHAATPRSGRGTSNRPTPFPSTVSGVLVPDTARTPTANVATRAAQPVATTTNGLDRSILVAPAAPTPTPGTRRAGQRCADRRADRHRPARRCRCRRIFNPRHQGRFRHR